MIHISQASYPVHVNMRNGTVMSMPHTATGRVFVAWLPPKVAQHYMERELDDQAVVTSATPLQPSPQALQKMVDERSEERRVGKECVSTCSSRWSPDHKTKNTYTMRYSLDKNTNNIQRILRH